MFFDKNEINIKDLYTELQHINNKLDYIINQNKFTVNTVSSIPDPCRSCPNHPSNGGSGICHCTLGTIQITC